MRSAEDEKKNSENKDPSYEINKIKTQSIASIVSIITEYSHYKNKKNFIQIFEYLNKKLNDKSITEMMREMTYRIGEKKFEYEEINDINKRLYTFVTNNKKDYINKIDNKDYTIYEYKQNYTIFINNKNIDIMKTINNLFPNKKIISFYIDNHLRKNLEKIVKDDIKLAKYIKINIEK